MKLENDIFTLIPSKNKTFAFAGAALPSAKDVFFRSKQEEIIEQYSTARLFLLETANDDRDHWFTVEDSDFQRAFELKFMGKMYEAALLFYNIVVDLSWVLCYVTAEYVLYENDKATHIDRMMNIEDASKSLRTVESAVLGPDPKKMHLNILKGCAQNFRTRLN